MDTTAQYFDWMCRTCMKVLIEASSFDGDIKPQQQWLSIADIIEEERCSLRIAELLSRAVPQIELQLIDELPKQICCKCLQELLNVNRFQQMCVQSEKQMQLQVSEEKTDLNIPAVALEGKTATNDASSNYLRSVQPSSGHESVDHFSVQEPFFETTQQVMKTEAVEIDDVDQLLEDRRDSQGNFSEFIKNEPIYNDEHEMDYSDGNTIQSIISVKEEVLALESAEQQINETNVKEHRITYGKDKPYECPYCFRKFSKKSNMVQHKQIHEGVKREDCDICGKSINKYNLKKHKLTHCDVKAHKCELCEKSFAVLANLRRHIRIHTGERPYECKYCERSFTHNSVRVKHMRHHLGDNVHRCELCPLTFPVPSELREHLITHQNEAPETREQNMKALKEAKAKLQLKFCKKETPKTSRPRNVKKRNRHDKDKPYECPYCPRTFTALSNMYEHKEIHERVKQEACNICGKIIRKKNLKRHKLTHDDKKAHKCDICEKLFLQKSQLSIHMRQHTGEKPFKCDYCESAFATYTLRRTHMSLHHLGANVYRCELCPLAFPAAKELRVHFTTHKNEDSETRERNMKALQEAKAKIF